MSALILNTIHLYRRLFHASHRNLKTPVKENMP